ncbi:RNase H domain-containing protein [Trichonephila clavipes]|nr:RNase H domain-containing protein [Trichonephila clavipes]
MKIVEINVMSLSGCGSPVVKANPGIWLSDFSCASDTNLDKLEKIQLSAARIITGLKRSCPIEIVLFEADLQPFKIRRAKLTKYFNKLSSYGQHNKTFLYFNNWCNNQRIKKNSLFSQAELLQLPFSDVEPHSLKSCLCPAKGFPKVHFHLDLSTPVIKGDLIPDHLRLLALEIIDGIPSAPTKIYTDGSRLSDRGGSGIYIEKRGEMSSFCHRSPDFSSVFKSELIAIGHGLEAVLNEQDFGDLLILSDSRSSLQHLYNWSSRRQISRLKSGRIKIHSFCGGKKTFALCTKCKTQQASPDSRSHLGLLGTFEGGPFFLPPPGIGLLKAQWSLGLVCLRQAD